MLVLTLVMFTAAWAFIKGCERIIGPDLESQRVDTEREEETAEEEAAA